MRKIIFFFLLLFGINSNAQTIMLKQLLLLNTFTIADVDYCMNKINCELINSDDKNGETNLTYNSRSTREYDIVSIGIRRTDKANILTYAIYKGTETEKLTDEVYNTGFRLVKTYNTDGVIEKLYRLDKVFLTISETKDKTTNDSIVGYTITELKNNN